MLHNRRGKSSQDVRSGAVHLPISLRTGLVISVSRSVAGRPLGSRFSAGIDIAI